MSLQKTISRELIQTDKCVYSGHYVQMHVFPAEPDTGLVFEVPRGEVKADYRRASAQRRSILLKYHSAKVLTPEHLLAIFFAYGIDNARIKLKRLKPSRLKPFSYLLTYGSRKLCELEGMNEPEVVPIIGRAEKRLCEKIEDCGVEEQDKERNVLRLEEPFETDKISFYPLENDDVIMQVTTDYRVVGKQTEELTITPETFKTKIASARPFGMHIGKYLFFLPKQMQMGAAKFFASLLNPTLGIGHGFDETNVFVPPGTAAEWHSQEIYPNEIARHTMTDKLAPFTLLDGRLEGVKMVVTPGSNHANDLAVFKELAKRVKKSVKKAAPIKEKELVLT